MSPQEHGAKVIVSDSKSETQLQNEVPALLESISSAARRAGLEISEVQPDGVVNGDQFDTYRYKIAVIGNYHALAEFLANVGSLTRIMAPANVVLSPATTPAGPKTRKGEAKIDCRLEIQTYVAKSTPAAPRRKS